MSRRQARRGEIGSAARRRQHRALPHSARQRAHALRLAGDLARQERGFAVLGSTARTTVHVTRSYSAFTLLEEPPANAPAVPITLLLFWLPSTAPTARGLLRRSRLRWQQTRRLSKMHQAAGLPSSVFNCLATCRCDRNKRSGTSRASVQSEIASYARPAPERSVRRRGIAATRATSSFAARCLHRHRTNWMSRFTTTGVADSERTCQGIGGDARRRQAWGKLQAGESSFSPSPLTSPMNCVNSAGARPAVLGTDGLGDLDRKAEMLGTAAPHFCQSNDDEDMERAVNPTAENPTISLKICAVPEKTWLPTYQCPVRSPDPIVILSHSPSATISIGQPRRDDRGV